MTSYHLHRYLTLMALLVGFALTGRGQHQQATDSFSIANQQHVATIIIDGGDEYGIVMGTSHHEPMMRAHKEYTRRRAEVGPWDYVTNKANIDRFFREGIERNQHYDNLVTIGMRDEVFDNMRWVDWQLPRLTPGIHTLRVYMVDPEVVLERIVVNPDNQHPSYFGAPAIRHEAY